MIRTIMLALALLVSIPAMADSHTKVVVIPLGGDDIRGLSFSGPQLNLPQKVAEAAGFSVCYSETYATSGATISSIFAICDKPEIMLACRPVNNPIFQLAAHAPRADVTHDTGGGNTDVTHAANGSEWYYNSGETPWSWGFAPAGNRVNKNNCDLAGTARDGGEDQTTPYRMCIHTSNPDATQVGWRCGTNYPENSSSYERVFLHR